MFISGKQMAKNRQKTIEQSDKQISEENKPNSDSVSLKWRSLTHSRISSEFGQVGSAGLVGIGINLPTISYCA